MARCEPLTAAAWHGDQPLPLELPEHWRIRTWWPDTPAQLRHYEQAVGYSLRAYRAPCWATPAW